MINPKLRWCDNCGHNTLVKITREPKSLTVRCSKCDTIRTLPLVYKYVD